MTKHKQSLFSQFIAYNYHTQSLALFKIFSNFVHFCPNFQIFCPFSEKWHPCPYLLEYAQPKQTFLLIYLDHPNKDFFLLGFTPCKAEQPLQGIGLQEKEALKD